MRKLLASLLFLGILYSALMLAEGIASIVAANPALAAPSDAPSS